MAATSSWLPGPPPGVDECRRRNLPSIFIVPLIMIIWKIQRYIYHGLSSTSSFPQHPRISKESKGNHGRIMYNNYIYIYIYNIYTWCIHNRQYNVSRIFSAKNHQWRKLLAFKELVEQAERQGLGLGSELEPRVSRWVVKFYQGEMGQISAVLGSLDMAMDQYLYIPFLGEWTSIYQLFWCSPGVQGFDTLPHLWILWVLDTRCLTQFLQIPPCRGQGSKNTWRGRLSDPGCLRHPGQCPWCKPFDR